jgi:hypothetical protein
VDTNMPHPTRLSTTNEDRKTLGTMAASQSYVSTTKAGVTAVNGPRCPLQKTRL